MNTADSVTCSGKGKKGKPNGITPELEEVWERDRTKKAEFKKLRGEARHEAASLGIPWKKHRILHGTAPDLLSPANDLDSVERLIRSFLNNIGGPSTLSLPAMSKEARKKVHNLAGAFNLKSQSKGKGRNRYTTLIKTTRSGIMINEGQIERIMGASGGRGLRPSGRGNGSTVVKHRDGDIVGKSAARIGEGNIGYMLLQQMGCERLAKAYPQSLTASLYRWSEGDRIGKTGGLDVPLTAVIKHSKLGLGATR